MKDDLVRPEQSRRTFQALRRTGLLVEYTELSNAGHNAWDATYGDSKSCHILE